MSPVNGDRASWLLGLADQQRNNVCKHIAYARGTYNFSFPLILAETTEEREGYSVQGNSWSSTDHLVT